MLVVPLPVLYLPVAPARERGLKLTGVGRAGSGDESLPQGSVD